MMDPLIVKNRSQILDLARRHHIRKVRLFGSMSREAINSEKVGQRGGFTMSASERQI